MATAQVKSGGLVARLEDGEEVIRFSDTIAGVRFAASAAFNQDSLFAVVLTAKVHMKNPAIREIAQAMVHDFGEPTEQEKTKNKFTHYWALPSRGMVMFNLDATQYISGNDSQVLLQLGWVAPVEYLPPRGPSSLNARTF